MGDARTLVTGGTGFIGGRFVASLAEAGADVHVLVRDGSPAVLPRGATVHRFRDAVVEVPEIVRDVAPEAVIHLATLFAAQHRPEQIRSMIESNVTFGTVVAEACVRTGARLVHATSAWQHVGGAEYLPVSLYAATKQAFVDVVEYYVSAEGLRAAEVCLFDTYGPADPRRKLVSLLLTHARSGEPLAMSSGRQLIDLTHVDDVVAALRLAASGAHDGGRLVARSGRPISVRELAGTVREVTGAALNTLWDARPDRPREMYTDWLVRGDTTSWRPSTTLDTGLAALWRSEFQ